MPLEKRQIILSENELLHALSAYRNVNTKFLPGGDILQVTIAARCADRPAEGVVVTVSIQMCYGDSQQKIDVPLRDADILSLLVRFCLENNVPIPRSGAKAAGAVDGKLALLIDYDHSETGCSQRDRATAKAC